ncbi:MAG: N-acetylmuramoyl-L-alanine amidase [Alphaproteobacteria bacterium]|nr:N-acetylmuramoyl-L-alanine amidase [Alphaproteobacteria bacterium]
MQKAIFRAGAVLALATLAHAQGGTEAMRSDSNDAITRLLIQSETSAAPKTPAPVVIGARLGEQDGRTRFVVELSDPVPMRTFSLSNPDRVVIDMPAVEWHEGSTARAGDVGAVKSFRYGLFRSGNSRIVIDLNQPVSVNEPLILPPENGYGYRVVIDMLPSTQAKFEQTAGWPADLKLRETESERVASLGAAPVQAPVTSAQKKIIVIDPGHGGIDAGTDGVNGMLEKDLVFDEAMRLARALEKTGTYTVHMTREADIYVPLNERVNIARSWHADLLISLHADSNPDRSVNGLSIYTLSESGSDKEAAALASKENESDVVAGVDLGGENSAVAPILIDLAQRDTMNRSSRFATAALEDLGGATDIMPREPHRSAAFVVLKSPDVPSVLIELGYLSNADDASRMSSPAWRDRVAEAIARAVDRQFATQAAFQQAPALP